MRNLVNRVSLVSSNKTAQSGKRTLISELSKRLEDVERQLDVLCAMENDILTSDFVDETDVYSQLEAIERLQRNLLTTVTNTPAENEEDILFKLEIWKRLVMPEGCDLAYAQLTDLLIQSVINDLVERTDS